MQPRRARRNPFGSKDLRQMASANPVPIKSGHKKTPPELGEVLSKGQRTPTPPEAIPQP